MNLFLCQIHQQYKFHLNFQYLDYNLKHVCHIRTEVTVPNLKNHKFSGTYTLGPRQLHVFFRA